MRHSCISFLSISLFLLTACSGEKGSHEQVSTVSIDKGVEHFDADYTSVQYQSLFKNPKTIRLETNDKCLLRDRKSTRLNSSHTLASRMPSSA